MLQSDKIEAGIINCWNYLLCSFIEFDTKLGCSPAFFFPMSNTVVLLITSYFKAMINSF